MKLRVKATGEIGLPHDPPLFNPGGSRIPEYWVVFVAEDGQVRFYGPDAVEKIEDGES